ARARDLEATLELRLRDPHGGPAAPLALHIVHGSLSVSPGPAAGAGATAELAAEDMVRLVAGSVGWPELVSSGRMTLSGDPFLALRFPGLFRLPAGR
ncbi:MAG: SCP2 sterol-binding domain-containing protein, partial [Actinomycetota bacterium]|nr:SCP2 sterol-binding domain-containing protein [Actinomycetota bacterium]